MRIIPQPYNIKETDGITSIRKITKFMTDETLPEEGYVLKICENEIYAYASNAKGFFYAKKTFEQISYDNSEIKCCEITDFPRFSYRGFMIDCARHMFSVNELKKIINAAAEVKFNRFHWHLSDDQGFRIELLKYPELTKKGSVRAGDNFGAFCRSEKPYCGYYTQDEIRDIIDFCAKRFIEVIPEFDMPGHLSSLLHVYPEYSCKGENIEVKQTNGIFKDVLCIGNPDAVNFMKGVLGEISGLFPGRYIHIGGDEAPDTNWKKCPRCREIIIKNNLKDERELQSWYINDITEYLSKNNKTAIVWNDCLKGKNLSDKVIIEHWINNKKDTAGAVKRGQKVILAPFTPYYCDYPYGMHPLKAVYKYEPDEFKGISEDCRKFIIGVETPVWTEFINSDDRLEYMCFPRWFAVAESAWTDKENKNYKQFEKALVKLCNMSRHQGIYTAWESEWNKNSLLRLKETSKFFSDIKKRQK